MKLTCHRYRIPFKKKFQSSKMSFALREGIIFCLEDRDRDITAYGETAPLPGFSLERLDQVISQLDRHYKKIRTIFESGGDADTLNQFYADCNIYPSLRFGLDTLALDYRSKQRQQPLSSYLLDHPPLSIPVNAVISIESTRQTLSEAARMVNKGYQTLKLKIGRKFTEELDTLQQLRDQFPDVAIRLDANRAWQPEEALHNLDRVAGLNIEYCEEPLQDPTPLHLKKIYDHSNIPIALDETLIQTKDINGIALYTSVFIVKPMITGSLSDFFATIHLAATHDNMIICTTSLESGIGRMMTAVLAAGWGSKKSAHGLATGNLLTMDVWQDGTYINSGNFTLPDLPGLGQSNIPALKDIAEIIDFQNGNE